MLQAGKYKHIVYIENENETLTQRSASILLINICLFVRHAPRSQIALMPSHYTRISPNSMSINAIAINTYTATEQLAIALTMQFPPLSFERSDCTHGTSSPILLLGQHIYVIFIIILILIIFTYFWIMLALSYRHYFTRRHRSPTQRQLCPVRVRQNLVDREGSVPVDRMP